MVEDQHNWQHTFVVHLTTPAWWQLTGEQVWWVVGAQIAGHLHKFLTQTIYELDVAFPF